MKTEDKYILYRPKKFLGQNFLVDENISKKIVNQLDLDLNDIVLEIGPGQGALSKYITGFCKEYIAIEIDVDIANSLNDKFGDKAEIINEDFLKYDLNSTGKNFKIIGNIPYNITSEILFKLFDNRDIIFFAVLMVQKEFAQRLIAGTNTKEYGILSVQTQAFCQPELLFNVPKTVFFPKPKVESSIIKLDFRKQVHKIDNIETFKTLVRSAFGKRRKILKNSLKDFFTGKNIKFKDYESMFGFTRRAEDVSVSEYVGLANRIYKDIEKC